jgi:2,4-dienoyl-CoA reductase-like NADH-dependent reductase (Old Yellow Enzyme family)
MNNLNETTLFTPLKSDKLSLINRIVMAPMTRGQCPNNIPTQAMVHYYTQRAKGGAGLIITECTFIHHPVANGFMNAPAFHGKKALQGWKNVVDQVHDAQGKIIPQIWHAGADREIGITPNATLPSVGPVDIIHNGQKIVKGLSQIEIQTIVSSFAKAAVQAKAIGFDGVELHAAHGYLIDQFLWSKSNTRRDEYGGNIENRVRFACQIVKSIRSAVGVHFPICFRFSQWKVHDYDARIVNCPSELERLLLPLVDAGVDIFHTSTRRIWEPGFSGSEMTLAGWTKKITGKPVIAVGQSLIHISDPTRRS